MLLGLVGVAAVLLAPQASSADETGTNNPVQTAGLDYAEMSFSMTSEAVDIKPLNAPSFKREPTLSSGTIKRGVLNLNPEATNAVGFIWDATAHKLHLDLNGNGDLTDDKEGVYTSKVAGNNYQTFDGVHLPFKTANASRQMLADLYLYYYGNDRLYCSASLRSMWKGKISLHGRDWQVGIVELFHARYGAQRTKYLLLRPWEKRNDSFSTYSSRDAFEFPSRLFFDNHAYHLDVTHEPQDNTSRYVIQFALQQPALGEMKITGRDIQRIHLEDGQGYFAVLEHPGPVAKLPAGNYSVPNMWLNKGGVTAMTSDPRISVRIADQKAAVLAAGGPLTNSVGVSHRGSSLSLNYKLVGVGGETYMLEPQDRSKPPRFEIASNGRKIASGSFQYG
jgi:hypothetical protein